MSLGRLLRTVRHLTPEQILFSVLRRIRHAAWRRHPAGTRRRLAAAARQLPQPDPRCAATGVIADRVALLQRTVHPEPVAALRSGRFTVLGEAVDLANVSLHWRCDTGVGSSLLRRLTLAYFGWAVPLLADGRAEDLNRIARVVAELDAVPWSEPGIFRDLWNPYTASHRLINLICGLHLYWRSGGTDTETVPALLQHIEFCAAFVLNDPERDIQANHLLKNWTALAVYAAATSAPERVFPNLAHEVRRSLDQLVLADGGHAERSPMYHALGLMDVELLRSSDAVPDLHATLDDAARRLRTALGLLTHPDGNIALFNDAWLNGAPTPVELNVDRPPPGRRILPLTGYTRLDGGPDVVIFDCGPVALDSQPGHAHADFLALELSVAGSRLIVDPGTATYAAGALREHTRSAASHNGPHILGHEPIEFWQSFRVGYRGTASALDDEGLADTAPLWCAGWHDGYRAFGEVRRWVGLWPGQGLLVVDLWPIADLPRCRSRFLIPAAWRQKARDVGHLVGPVTVEARAAIGRISPAETAAWWPCYDIQESATAFDLQPAHIDGFSAAALVLDWGGVPRLPDVDLRKLIAGLAAAPRSMAA